MLVSLKWLRDFVDVADDAQALADRMTMSGLEVKAVKPAAPDFAGVVVARILSRRRHPDAERLSLCDVDAGAETVSVVCGADNMQPGDLVALAKVGGRIPGGYEIRHSRIRGEASAGMLCSEAELAIGTDDQGILILPAHLRPGQDLAEALDLHDTIFDIGVTPNRGDCLSMLGIAREIAALTDRPLRLPATDVVEGGGSIGNVASVTIDAPDLCPRYTARLIRNVRIGPSPLWMKCRLEAAGLRAINNVVDVTNYVMMELGQPLHAFDFRFLEGRRIVVRRAAQDERFLSLDGKERLLQADALLICDGAKAVAIAGIMGGLNSEVQSDTTDIFLESAYFHPASIRRTARRLGLNTDSAYRFERGVDPGGVLFALNRAARLMVELAGGVASAGMIDAHPRPIETGRPIDLRLARINEILGTALADAEVSPILRRLGMAPAEKSGAPGTFVVIPPSFRGDVTREIDLIEEIARLHGYDRIPVSLPRTFLTAVRQEPKRKLIEKARNCLSGLGFSEAITYSFISPRAVDRLRLAESDERRKMVQIRTPLSEDQSVMRTTLLWGLLETLRKNGSQGCTDMRILEVGRVFFSRGLRQLPEERDHLACLMSGARYDDLWHYPGVQADFFDMKGALEALADALKLSEIGLDEPAHEPFLHPGRSAWILAGGQRAGFFGEIHPRVLRDMDLKGRVQVCEIDVSLLLARYDDRIACRQISRYPASVRDVAFVVRKDLPAGGLLRTIGDMREELLEHIGIFDVYAGAGLPSGTKSLGIRFRYRAPDRTLTEEEVNGVHAAIVARVTALTDAKIRGEG